MFSLLVKNKEDFLFSKYSGFNKTYETYKTRIQVSSSSLVAGWAVRTTSSYSVLTREELGERDGDAQDAAHVPVSAPGQRQTRSECDPPPQSR